MISFKCLELAVSLSFGICISLAFFSIFYQPEDLWLQSWKVLDVLSCLVSLQVEKERVISPTNILVHTSGVSVKTQVPSKVQTLNTFRYQIAHILHLFYRLYIFQFFPRCILSIVQTGKITVIWYLWWKIQKGYSISLFLCFVFFFGHFTSSSLFLFLRFIFILNSRIWKYKE